jgi:OOP family OmpA-OmpF porin
MRTFLFALLIGSTVACSHAVTFEGQGVRSVASTARPAPPPPAPPPRVEVRDNKIEIHEKIQFDFDKATIKEASFDLMNEIVKVIASNPQIKRIRVEGYASSEGSADHNQKLSKDRAGSVMSYLTSHGIAAKELAAQGYGAEKPIADNNTEEGREQNRRVEFVILEEDVTKKRVEVDPKTGAEKVVGEQHEMVTAEPDAGHHDVKERAKGVTP